MSFDIPPSLFGVGAAAANAKSTQKALEAQSAEMRRLLMQGKDIPCPYCQQLIAKDAYVCSQCQGVLSIGSWEAIRAAIQIDPSLAFRDSETFEKLSKRVEELDQHWADLAKKQQLREQRKLEIERHKKNLEKKRLDEIQRKKIDDRNAYLKSLNPTRRWIIKNKVMCAILVLIIICGSLLLYERNYQISAAKTFCSNAIPQLKSDAGALSKLQLRYAGLQRNIDSWWAQNGGNRHDYSTLPTYEISAQQLQIGDKLFDRPNYKLQTKLRKIIYDLKAITTHNSDLIHSDQKFGLNSYLLDDKYKKIEPLIAVAQHRINSMDIVFNGFKFDSYGPYRYKNLESQLDYPEAFFTSKGTGDDKPTLMTNNQEDGFNDDAPEFSTYLGLKTAWNDLSNACKKIQN